jgi:hypothetical protein
MNRSQFTLCAFALWLMLGPFAHADWKADFLTALSSLEIGTFPAELVDKPADAAEIAAAEMQTGIADFHDSVPAMFGLWLREDRQSFLELTWWKKRDNDRVSRAFVIALYYCAQVEPVSWLPAFDAHFDRFAEREKTQRSDEFAFVMAHRSAIAEKLAQGLEASGRADAPAVRKMAARYRQTAAMKLGEALR